MRQKISKSQLEELANEAHDMFKDDNSGANASYIPYLANIDSKLFGISIATADGDVVEVGDTKFVFGIESISKLPAAALAAEQSGTKAIQDKIGCNATGLPFGSELAIILENHSPGIPLVNAGAIATNSMLLPTGHSDEKWSNFVEFFNKLAGSPLTLIDQLYKSETATNFHNRSIGWLLKSFDHMYDDVDMSVDLYTRGCSLGVTSTQIALMAATFANGGVNPVTKQQVIQNKNVKQMISLVATVGMYEQTGDWMYDVGVPTKSGVGGGLLGIVPGVLGFGTFSPPLDGTGNSVRGQKAIAYISDKLKLNIFG